MRSRDEFVRKWKNHLAGMALCGIVSESRDSPLQRGDRVLEIPTATPTARKWRQS
jgi:hypothetical protein